MTLPLRRKPRTTPPRTTRLRTAASLAAALALGGAASAQQFNQPPAQFGRNPTQQAPQAGPAIPGGRPGSNPGMPPRGASPYGSPRPMPPGVTDVPPAPERLPAPGSAGRVLYFHKPAGSATPDPNPDTGPDPVATVAGTADVPPAPPAVVPDARVVPPAVAPQPPVPVRVAPVVIEPTEPGYIPPPLPATPPPGYPAVVQTPAPERPQPTTSQKPRQDLGKPIEEDPRKRDEWARLPPRQAIFQMYTDEKLQDIIIRSVARENKIDPSRLQFPDLDVVRNRLVPPGTTYTPKTAYLPPGQILYEPNYVVHRRLHFEEKNAERYGWDFGIVQPLVSTAYFWKDALLWPNSLGTGLVTGFWDTSAGKCLPGSPVPYLLYPPNLTATGMMLEGGIITGVGFMLAPLNSLPVSTAVLVPR